MEESSPAPEEAWPATEKWEDCGGGGHRAVGSPVVGSSSPLNPPKFVPALGRKRAWVRDGANRPPPGRLSPAVGADKCQRPTGIWGEGLVGATPLNSGRTAGRAQGKSPGPMGPRLSPAGDDGPRRGRPDGHGALPLHLHLHRRRPPGEAADRPAQQYFGRPPDAPRPQLLGGPGSPAGGPRRPGLRSLTLLPPPQPPFLPLS